MSRFVTLKPRNAFQMLSVKISLTLNGFFHPILRRLVAVCLTLPVIAASTTTAKGAGRTSLPDNADDALPSDTTVSLTTRTADPTTHPVQNGYGANYTTVTGNTDGKNANYTTVANGQQVPYTRSVRDVLTPEQQTTADSLMWQTAGANGVNIMNAPMYPGPGPAVMPSYSWAVSEPDFSALITAVSNQTFASNQLPMIQAAGLCGWFTSAQCAALMNIFDFDDNKLKVVRYIAPHLIDPIHCQPIMNALSFITNRQEAWRIISGARL